MADLSGRTALVTGANQGIGAAIAQRFGAAGARVAVCSYAMASADHPEGRNLPADYATTRAGTSESVAERIVAVGGQAGAFDLDLRDVAAIGPLFDAVEARLGPVDILVNNASAWRPDTFTLNATDAKGRRLTRVCAANFDANFAVDARGSALMMAEFARRYLERDATEGWVLGLTSGGALGFPEEATYGAAKAAMESYTMTLAMELKVHGVRANTLHPPVTDTGWLSADLRAEFEADGLRIARPGEVAAVALELCAPESAVTAERVLMPSRA